MYQYFIDTYGSQEPLGAPIGGIQSACLAPSQCSSGERFSLGSASWPSGGHDGTQSSSSHLPLCPRTSSSRAGWTMSSATSTRTSTFRPWHLFTLAGTACRHRRCGDRAARRPGRADPARVGDSSAGAGVGFGIYRTIWPLADSRVSRPGPSLIGGRTRAALDREKTLVLRAIKELEFDRAMGKVSDSDFRLMGERLRARAIALMRQLDDDTPGYRERIERELAERLQGIGEEPVESGAETRPVCDACGANNESDAKFCKRCGSALNGGVAAEDAE